jgi:hypothetical protein
MSPQDVIIVCNDITIRTHSVVLHQSNYFATLLDDAELDTSGSDSIRTIPLPAAFDYTPSEVREFIMVLYDTIDVAGVALQEHFIVRENVIALAQLAHYFDAPLLQIACDKILAKRYAVCFPNQIPFLKQVAITNHLPDLREACMDKLARTSRALGC